MAAVKKTKTGHTYQNNSKQKEKKETKVYNQTRQRRFLMHPICSKRSQLRFLQNLRRWNITSSLLQQFEKSQSNWKTSKLKSILLQCSQISCEFFAKPHLPLEKLWMLGWRLIFSSSYFTNKISGNPNLGGVFRGFFGVGGI